tara:strand:+ start:48 stop:617 length:570 start_codon:yes stop_codon:yes gene_type:complete
MQVTFKFTPAKTTGEMADHLYKRVKTADAIPASAEITAKEAVTDGKSVIHPAIEWKRERKYEPATYEYRVFDMEFEFELEEDGETIDPFKVFEKWLSSDFSGFGAAEDLPAMFDITAEYEAKTFTYTYKKEFYGTLDAQECADNNITSEYEATEYIQDNHDSLYPDEGEVDDVETEEEGSETVVLQVKN